MEEGGGGGDLRDLVRQLRTLAFLMRKAWEGEGGWERVVVRGEEGEGGGGGGGNEEEEEVEEEEEGEGKGRCMYG